MSLGRTFIWRYVISFAKYVCVCILCLTSSQMFCGHKDLASIEEFHLGQIVAGLLKHYDRWQ